MAGVNKAILVGRLGQDPEVRHTQDGKAVANLSVATSEKWNGEEKTEWHKVVSFGKVADFVSQYLTKGSLVYVEGKIQTKQWEKDGVKRYTTEIIANTIQGFGGSQQKQADTPDYKPLAPDDVPF